MNDERAPDAWGEPELSPDRYTFVPLVEPRDEGHPGFFWIRVLGGGLPQPIELKLGRRGGGRLSVLGLRIDNSNHSILEIDSTTLRSIKLGEILRQLGGIAPWQRRSYSADEEDAFLADLLQAQATDDLVALVSRDLGETPPPAKQGKTPDDQQLSAFVAAYRRELLLNPRRAMTVATRQANMARSTGYRWLEMAERRGLYQRDVTK